MLLDFKIFDNVRTKMVASNENKKKICLPDFGKADELQRELCIAKQFFMYGQYVMFVYLVTRL
jgi:hypothetical protein